MTKNKLKLIATGAGLLVLIAVGFVAYKNNHLPIPAMKQVGSDEFTGSWRGEGETKDGYKWFVVYTFENGRYHMTTDSAMKDDGTYSIVKRFEDNASIQMSKTSETFKKTYDIYITMAPDKKSIMIDGMKLVKQ